jgi:tagatose 1,6-diphosphate aldolase
MLGRYRHFTRASTADGHFLVLAIDHRANLWDQLAAHGPIDNATFTNFKQALIGAAAGKVTATLADPAYGIGPAVAARTLTGGLIAPLEVTNYNAHASSRRIQLIDDWSVGQIKRVGGDGAKLLVYYHPESPHAVDQRWQVARLLEQCREHDLPLYLEPIPCPPSPQHTLSQTEHDQLVIELARIFSNMGVDVLKVGFPSQSENPADWGPACTALDKACGQTIWTLLSAGVPYPTFAAQAAVACAHGASGLIVGRALWGDAAPLRGAALAEFLQSTYQQRLTELAGICQQASPWFSRVPPPDHSLYWYV